MIRPLRDAFGSGSGAQTIKYLALAVFLCMLAIVPAFAWLVAKVRRAILLPLTYGFFVVNLVVFAGLFHFDPENIWVGRVFYVWATVFNLFVVSVFWSFMSEIWQESEGRRLFGVIAAGGSLGGLLGSMLTAFLVGKVGTQGIALIAAGLLAGTLVTINLLTRVARTDTKSNATIPKLNEPVGGGMFAGLFLLVRSPFLLGIAALIAAGSLLGMFLYIEMAQMVQSIYATASERTAFYAQRDLWVNSASLVLQFFVVGWLTSKFGVRTTMTAVFAVIAAAFAGLALSPTIGVLVIINVVTRSLEFGISKPNRDMLYTVVDVESKYKVKNLVDTVIYRASDVVSGFIHAALVGLGATLSGIALLSIAFAGFIAWIAFAVGSGYRNRGGF